MTDTKMLKFIKDTDKEFDDYCDPRDRTTKECALKKYMADNDVRSIDCQMLFLVFKLVGDDIL